jgi:hypothetical protein
MPTSIPEPQNMLSEMMRTEMVSEVNCMAGIFDTWKVYIEENLGLGQVFCYEDGMVISGNYGRKVSRLSWLNIHYSKDKYTTA